MSNFGERVKSSKYFLYNLAIFSIILINQFEGMYGIKHNQTIVFASVARGGDTGELILTLLPCGFVFFLLCKMTARVELYGSHVMKPSLKICQILI